MVEHDDQTPSRLEDTPYLGHGSLGVGDVVKHTHGADAVEARACEREPLGVAHDASYVMSHASLLDRDVLLMYSDGVLEAPNADGVQFGDERLRTTLDSVGKAGPTELKRGIIDRFRAWTGGSLEHDDVTLIAVQLYEHGGVRAE